MTLLKSKLAISFAILSHILDVDSDSEGSQQSSPSVQNEKTLLEKLEMLSNQRLIQVVKVFVDWLRTNTDIILTCAQVSEHITLCQ